MTLWTVAITIAVFGAIGGFFNAIILEGGFVKGGFLPNPDKKVWSLGFVSNILCGAFAAFVSWGLYGSLSSANLLNSADLSHSTQLQLTLATLCGAALTGFSGASWLTTQAGKNGWKTTAITAMQAPASPEAAARMAKQTPQEAFIVADKLRRQTPPEGEILPIS